METSSDLQACADLVAYACRDHNVYKAASTYTNNRIWMSSTDIRGHAIRRRSDAEPAIPDKFGSAMLQRAAKAGLIVARKNGPRRDAWCFTTLKLAAAWDTETALTDGERAERCATAVRNLYQRNIREYGDQVRHWPVGFDLNAVPQDGIQHAIDGGLLRRVDLTGPLAASGYLVPVECWDAYADALEAAENRAERAQARHKALADRVYAYTGGNRWNVDRLDADQMERLLALIEPADNDADA